MKFHPIRWLRDRVARFFNPLPPVPMQLQVTVTAPMNSGSVVVSLMATAAVAVTILVQTSPPAAAPVTSKAAAPVVATAAHVASKPIARGAAAVSTMSTRAAPVAGSTTNSASPSAANTLAAGGQSKAPESAMLPTSEKSPVVRAPTPDTKAIRDAQTTPISDRSRTSSTIIGWVILFAVLIAMMAINHTPGGTMVLELLRSTGALALLGRAARMALNRVCERWPRLKPCGDWLRRMARMPVTHEIGKEMKGAVRHWFDDLWEWLKHLFSPSYQTLASP